ncbi:nitric oxide reductase activation protein NorD [Denitromonas ohlonensis]|uniref:Nitric oxide reductase n=2 Tax=Denitromonas TaxID=139331 RepID=A0A557S163_9RHOO|nr:VWA domain-containing protein [Denitromonas ohlonensis]TVO59915.1 nitric oxide reductase [Denitromonas ohlonensis]TVO71170.1 nitric oxide reductase [Denitromonas ohlonensis]TVT76838.1 MAG: nitric oxide reductase [Denitromonas halophila]
MEEYVGDLWHKFITRSARRDYPDAIVHLEDIEKTAGVLFRALGGDPGLRVAAAAEVEHGSRRRWLARVAHIEDRVAHATRDAETLNLPPSLSLFPDRAANRDLYLWLIAQAAATGRATGDWLIANQQATLFTLQRYPGFESRYRRLVTACLELRLPPEKLPKDEAAVETAIRQALNDPGSIGPLPASKRPPQPVPLWLYPSPAQIDRRTQPDDAQSDPQDPDEERGDTVDATQQRQQATREDMPDGENGFILPFRAESLVSWAEYVKVNRALDEDTDDDAAKAAPDMDKLAIARDGKTIASRVRFDLDLPSAAADDIPLKSGILLPEWDWKKRILKKDQCRLDLLDARDAPPIEVPERLRKPVRKVRQQLEALAPSRRWFKNQPDGSELDVDACVRSWSDRRAGHSDNDFGSYLKLERHERDMACLVLADLSLSTDAWVSDTARVIDVIRDSLMMFSEALGATGDNFALYGFSSRRRENIRFHQIKTFEEKHGAPTRGRIAALKPGYYTRMGAAIRYASRILEKQPNALRLMLILSDGKPNDLDQYDSRYGIEDTRMSLIEARTAGLKPFCVTIDKEGEGYLPHLFGPAGFTVIRKPEDLPSRLPMLYAQLTAM